MEMPMSLLKLNRYAGNTQGNSRHLSQFLSATEYCQNSLTLSVQSALFHRCSALLGVKGIALKMPALSPTMTEGTIIKWLKKEGDSFAPGDVLCEVQTDKAVVGVEMEEEGVLAKIILSDDTKDVKIGAIIALTVEAGQDWKDVEMPVLTGDEHSQPEKKAPAQQITPASVAKAETPSHSFAGGAIGPAVKNLLIKYGLEASQLLSSGPKGTLLKGDVLKYVEANKLTAVDQKAHGAKVPNVAAKSATAGLFQTGRPSKPKFVDVEVSSMRRTIAKRLTESKSQIPHTYSTIECDMDNVTQIRKQLMDQGVKVSVNDFIVKAVAIALVKVPELNVLYQNGEVKQESNVDVSVAVATPNGLITPIVKGANTLTVDQISTTVKQLADKARQGKLQPNEFIGGTFTISNLGMFGIREFSAIINPPQVAILAIGTTRPVLVTPGHVVNKMAVTLSYDARAVAPNEAALFMETFKEVIQTPGFVDQTGAGPGQAGQSKDQLVRSERYEENEISKCEALATSAGTVGKGIAPTIVRGIEEDKSIMGKVKGFFG